MKTYLIETFNRFKRFSESFDVQATLCNKSWWVFNDAGEKEIYIFEEDKSLIISVNGIVTKGSWKYLSANKSLLIETTNSTVMLRPAFVDFTILSMQLDGTDNYAFLIDETNKELFHPNTLTQIIEYFEKKQQLLDYSESLLNYLNGNNAITIERNSSQNEYSILELENNTTFLVNRNEYSEIGVGSIVTTKDGTCVDGEFTHKDGKIQYKITKGKIVSVKNFTAFNTIEGLILLMANYNDKSVLDNVEVQYANNSTIAVYGNFTVKNDKFKAIIQVVNGIITDSFFIVEYVMSNGDIMTIYQKQYYSFAVGEKVLVNRKTPKDGKCVVKDHYIEIKSGKIEKILSDDLYLVLFVGMLLIMIFGFIIFVIAKLS